jgi:endonuclease/exonuclease/phosphatase family metal-dependent hydrolase
VSNVWDLEEAYRNDPFMVSFVSANGNFDFTMLLVHTRWSNDNEGTRANEVAMLVEQVSWMREFVNERDWILAGDFNYSGTSSHMQNMAEALELEQVDLNEKTTFNGDASGYKSAYDHIYLSASETSEFVGPCRAMDVTTVVYGSHTQANGKRARSELSDHLPVWAVFSTAGPDDD